MYQQDSIQTQFTRLMFTIASKLNPDRRPFVPLAQAEIDKRCGDRKGVWKDDDKVSRSTKINEQTFLNHVVNCKGSDIRCCDITHDFIRDVYDYLGNLRNGKGEPLKESTKGTYMSSGRSLLNRLGLNGDRLFDGINTRNGKAEVEAIGEEEIQSLKRYALTLAEDSFIYLALMLFLFCLSAQGMPFIDLAFLKWEMTGGKTIVYRRHKTGVRVEVPVTDFMRSVIDKLGNRKSAYVFGLLHSLEPEKAMEEYLSLLGRYNHALRQAGERAGLTVKLTSYVARHSWATIAYLRNYSIAFISKALGHTNILTTERYIKSICNKDYLRCCKEVAEIINLDIPFNGPAQKEAI